MLPRFLLIKDKPPPARPLLWGTRQRTMPSLARTGWGSVPEGLFQVSRTLPRRPGACGAKRRAWVQGRGNGEKPENNLSRFPGKQSPGTIGPPVSLFRSGQSPRACALGCQSRENQSSNPVRAHFQQQSSKHGRSAPGNALGLQTPNLWPESFLLLSPLEAGRV